MPESFTCVRCFKRKNLNIRKFDLHHHLEHSNWFLNEIYQKYFMHSEMKELREKRSVRIRNSEAKDDSNKGNKSPDLAPSPSDRMLRSRDTHQSSAPNAANNTSTTSPTSRSRSQDRTDAKDQDKDEEIHLTTFRTARSYPQERERFLKSYTKEDCISHARFLKLLNNAFPENETTFQLNPNFNIDNPEANPSKEFRSNQDWKAQTNKYELLSFLFKRHCIIQDILKKLTKNYKELTRIHYHLKIVNHPEIRTGIRITRNFKKSGHEKFLPGISDEFLTEIESKLEDYKEFNANLQANLSLDKIEQVEKNKKAGKSGGAGQTQNSNLDLNKRRKRRRDHTSNSDSSNPGEAGTDKKTPRQPPAKLVRNSERNTNSRRSKSSTNSTKKSVPENFSNYSNRAEVIQKWIESYENIILQHEYLYKILIHQNKFYFKLFIMTLMVITSDRILKNRISYQVKLNNLIPVLKMTEELIKKLQEKDRDDSVGNPFQKTDDNGKNETEKTEDQTTEEAPTCTICLGEFEEESPYHACRK